MIIFRLSTVGQGRHIRQNLPPLSDRLVHVTVMVCHSFSYRHHLDLASWHGLQIFSDTLGKVWLRTCPCGIEWMKTKQSLDFNTPIVILFLFHLFASYNFCLFVRNHSLSDQTFVPGLGGPGFWAGNKTTKTSCLTVPKAGLPQIRITDPTSVAWSTNQTNLDDCNSAFLNLHPLPPFSSFKICSYIYLPPNDIWVQEPPQTACANFVAGKTRRWMLCGSQFLLIEAVQLVLDWNLVLWKAKAQRRMECIQVLDSTVWCNPMLCRLVRMPR